MVFDTLGALAARFTSRTTLLQPAIDNLASRDSETLARQLRLAQIPSPTGAEQQRAAEVASLFNELGWHTRISEVGNVVASRAVNSKSKVTESVAPVVCLAHLDSVFPLSTVLSPTLEGTRHICPGIGDNCRGLTSILALAEALGASAQSSSLNVRRPIEFVATVGEEGLGNLRGAQHYFAECDTNGAPRAHAAIVIDGAGDSTIVHHGLGSRRFRISFRGKGGHSWADFGTPNSVHAAARATTWLADLPRAFNQRVALTVSRIGGGESINSIPSESWMDVDVRSTDAAVLDLVETELRAIVESAARAELQSRNGVDVKSPNALITHIELTGARPTGSLPLEHPLIRSAQFATRMHGVEPISAVASTDANVPLSLGIPAITIGGGGTGGGAHTLHEWYDNTNATRGLARALAIVVAAAAD
ncbi:MAG: M20/M25/M40 family metallo-hydrolase [Gemmatimonadaceae bacterium]